MSVDKPAPAGASSQFLVRFAPWIAFLVVASFVDWRLAAGVGLVTLLVSVVTMPPHRPGVLDLGMLVFFVVVGIVALVDEHSALQEWLNVASSSWLAVVAITSNLVGHPFTLDISSPGRPSEVVRSALFRSVNRTITWAWSAAFAGIAVSGAVAELLDRRVLGTMVSVGILIATIKFTRRHPAQAVAVASQRTVVGEGPSDR